MGVIGGHGRWRVVAAASLAVLAGSAAACGDDQETAGPETGTDVEDVATDYFRNDEYVGQNVTVSAEVTEVLSPTSFELAGEEYGDETLLVVSAQRATQVQEGDLVQVTGTVRDFAYEEFADQYGLAEDPGRYDPYAEEEVLVAGSTTTSVPRETPDE